jgi:hypothetical protein
MMTVERIALPDLSREPADLTVGRRHGPARAPDAGAHGRGGTQQEQPVDPQLHSAGAGGPGPWPERAVATTAVWKPRRALIKLEERSHGPGARLADQAASTTN